LSDIFPKLGNYIACEALKFFKAAAELGLEGIVSKRASCLYRPGPSRNWLKTKNIVESEFVLLGTEVDDSGIPWALLAREQNGELEFAGPAISIPQSEGYAQARYCEGTVGRLSPATGRADPGFVETETPVPGTATTSGQTHTSRIAEGAPRRSPSRQRGLAGFTRSSITATHPDRHRWG
jgi:hypothetical protein